ncbi:hypothetical protein [Sphingomonas sp. PR090111-T3T-6A]|uniref:hypothetical protein n=1 Tax=Sphingomonas sp. PR090111-T3T-6A TaxID=685778 RepID=UPI0003722520|nr:hypothetical protein [Sphingomonas sp. PR090111-T3T-6A]
MIDDPVATISRDPLWLAHRYDPGHDAIHFRPVSRADHRRATFLTDQHLPTGAEPVVLRREEAVQAAGEHSGPLHFVFHSAFCCSTLVARALDREGWAMGLKEPVILNDLVGWRRRGANPGELRTVLSGVLTLLARPFGPGEAVIVKPSNVANGLAMEMMAQRPDARALLIYAPLRDFLISIVKKGLDGRLFARDIFLNLLKDGLVRADFTQDQLFGQTDLQIAALGWLAQQDLFRAMALRFGAPRVRTISSEVLLAEPRQAMGSIARLFGLAHSDETIDALVSGPAFNTHSKTGQTFGSSERSAEYASTVAHHADEIDKVCVWLESVARGAGIELDPGAGILAS